VASRPHEVAPEFEVLGALLGDVEESLQVEHLALVLVIPPDVGEADPCVIADQPQSPEPLQFVVQVVAVVTEEF
jgi:hypothetical protein